MVTDDGIELIGTGTTVVGIFVDGIGVQVGTGDGTVTAAVSII
jgi:hypothetical protein